MKCASEGEISHALNHKGGGPGTKEIFHTRKLEKCYVLAILIPFMLTLVGLG